MLFNAKAGGFALKVSVGRGGGAVVFTGSGLLRGKPLLGIGSNGFYILSGDL